MANTPSGIPVTNRVENFGDRRLHAAVVDNILDSPTWATRAMGMGKRFMGNTMDFTVKIEDSGLGQFFTGLETLSTSASDTTVTMSYAHTGFAQPKVNIMLEAFANAGEKINLNNFKIDEAIAETISRLGTASFGLGTGNQPLGLRALADDGTDASTIGGQSRSTYSSLQGYYNSAVGDLSLAKLATAEDSVSAAGMESERPTIHVTDKTSWSYFEQLQHPNVRAEYASVGYNRLPIRGNSIVKSADLRGGAGFTALSWRGRPAIADDKCPSGYWFMVNENYTGWLGRARVPDEYRDFVTKVDLGRASTMEGVGAERPSRFNGFFVQKDQMLPHQAGIVGRYFVIGQFYTSQPRRNAKLAGITGV